MSAQFVERRAYPKACEVEVGVQFKNIGGSRDFAARERIVGDFATARETDVAKDVAFCAVDADVLVSTNTVSVFTMRPRYGLTSLRSHRI